MLDNDYYPDESEEYTSTKMQIPIWGFLSIFFLPAIIVTTYLYQSNYDSLDNTAVAIIGLAVMNGSINSVIAWLTIRLDGHSNDALEHLDTIIGAMDEFDETISDGMRNVSSFTTDLNEAKEIFSKIGVDLTGLDLEPVAEVVEKLKDNKEDLGELLDSMKEADFASYIEQVKGIDWSSLLASIEEVMTFIEAKNRGNTPSNFVTPQLPTDLFGDEDEGDFFNTPTLTLAPPPKRKLNLSPPRRKEQS